MRWLEAVRRGAVFCVVALLVVWAGYGFEYGPLPPGMGWYEPPAKTLVAKAQPAVKQVVARRNLPAPAFVRGMIDLVRHNAQGHEAYLLGEVKTSGWWYYFPVALVVKTTLPLLLLATLAIVVWLAGRGGRQPILYPMLGVAAILVVCLPSSMNIGIRHILPVYPFLALTAAGLFGGLRLRPPAARLVMGVAAALVVWHGGESLLAHPDYLAYFNQVARGREEHYLLDSNLDWGQDLGRLQRYLQAHGVDRVYLSYFGTTDPAVLGLAGARPLPAEGRPSGWIAVSKSHLAGLYTKKGTDLSWLKSHTPAARIGKSMLLYYISEESAGAAR